MITLSESDLISPPNLSPSGGTRNDFRYSLTKERNSHFLSLEIPNARLSEFDIEAEDSKAAMNVRFVKGSSIGQEDDAWFVVLRKDENGQKLFRRGNLTKAVRIGLYQITAENEEEARNQARASSTPMEAQVGEHKALIFRLPRFAAEFMQKAV